MLWKEGEERSRGITEERKEERMEEARERG